MNTRTYSEMILLPTFKERFDYLKCGGIVGLETFGGHRYLNQILYSSSEWKNFRKKVILRDNGCDLACEGFPIHGRVYIHHINPITVEDVLKRNHLIFDMNNVISVSFDTHNGLHYMTEYPKSTEPIERKMNDTCLWR